MNASAIRSLDLIGDLFLVGPAAAGADRRLQERAPPQSPAGPAILEQEENRHAAKRWSIATPRWTSAASSASCPTAIRCCWWIGCWKSWATTKATGIKNVTFNDIFFQGHYPGTPIMPGVLIVEAMAQLGGLLLSQKLEHTGKLAVLLSMDKVKMRQPVVPGDQLLLEAVAVRVKSRTGPRPLQGFRRRQARLRGRHQVHAR